MSRQARFILIIPPELMEEARAIATVEKWTITASLRNLIKHGLYVYRVMKDPAARLLVEENGTQREIVLV